MTTARRSSEEGISLTRKPSDEDIVVGNISRHLRDVTIRDVVEALLTCLPFVPNVYTALSPPIIADCRALNRHDNQVPQTSQCKTLRSSPTTIDGCPHIAIIMGLLQQSQMRRHIYRRRRKNVGSRTSVCGTRSRTFLAKTLTARTSPMRQYYASLAMRRFVMRSTMEPATRMPPTT